MDLIWAWWSLDRMYGQTKTRGEYKQDGFITCAFHRIHRRSHSSRMMKPGRMSDKFGPVIITLL